MLKFRRIFLPINFIRFASNPKRFLDSSTRPTIENISELIKDGIERKLWSTFEGCGVISLSFDCAAYSFRTSGLKLGNYLLTKGPSRDWLNPFVCAATQKYWQFFLYNSDYYIPLDKRLLLLPTLQIDGSSNRLVSIRHSRPLTNLDRFIIRGLCLLPWV